jgi:hypothetical protein
VSPKHARRTVVIALLSAACAQPSDTTAEADETAETGSTTEATSEGTETSDEDTGTTGDGDGDGDGDNELYECDRSRDCPGGHACINYECTAVEEVAECPAPMFTNIGLPSQNGLIVAFDLVDLDQDGADELVAWNQDLGIMLLSDGEWVVSPYPKLLDYSASSLTAVLVDDDEHYDIVLSGHINEHFAVGLGDGAGQFQFQPDLENALLTFSDIQRIVLEPDRVHAIGIDYSSGTSKTKLLRFNPGLVPELVEVTTPNLGYEFMLAEFDGTIGDELLIPHDIYTCRVWSMRHVVGTNQFDSVEHYFHGQESTDHCGWVTADLDGNGHDELVAAERLKCEATEEELLLSVHGNKTAAHSDAGFYPRKLARVPERFFDPGRWLVLDTDGDNRDEMLLMRVSNPGALLMWADEGQHLGCRAVVDVTDVGMVRAGDLDGDGDDELFILQTNGLLVVRDRI